MPDTILQTDSIERVAFDLLLQIRAAELDSAKQDRSYYFKLYRDCLDAVSGYASGNDAISDAPGDATNDDTAESITPSGYTLSGHRQSEG